MEQILDLILGRSPDCTKEMGCGVDLILRTLMISIISQYVCHLDQEGILTKRYSYS
jgi:hypothetical protein